jgi:isochorismate synthase
MTIEATVQPSPRPQHDLLAAYRPGAGSVFASPAGVLLGEGVAEHVAGGGAASLPARVAALLEGHGPDAVAVGAFPFDPGRPARIHRPERVRHAPRSPFGRRPPVPAPEPVGGWRLTPVPAPEAYAAAVDRLVDHLRAPGLDKVVLARALDVEAGHELDLRGMTLRLAAHDPHAFTFAVDLAEPGRAPRVLLGASPELLVARRGDVVRAQPLAGSAPRSGQIELDRHRADRLLRSEKDRHEHALVVDAVAAALAPLCDQLDVPPQPSIVRTRSMMHLGTAVTGRLADPRTTSLELALALHPTPAVCGSPAGPAAALIDALEPFDRELYAGGVGWQDAGGDGEWAVTIRCAIAAGRSLRLFSGAGVVAGSTGAAELAETTAKLDTFLSVLGLREGAA